MAEARSNLVLDFEGRRVTVAKDRFTLGRGPECDFTVEDDEDVSRVHVEILRTEDGKYEVRDAESTNGTLLNDVRVGTDAVAMKSGDRVRFGGTTFTVAVPQGETRIAIGATRMAASPIPVVATQGPGKGVKILLSESPVTVGRDEGCDFAIDDEELSRTHARLEVAGPAAVKVEDLDSQNGVFVGRRRIAGSEVVSLGGEFQLGRTTFSVGGAAPSPTTPQGPPGTFDLGGTDDEADTTPIGTENARVRKRLSGGRHEDSERAVRGVTILAGIAIAGILGLTVAVLAGVFSGDSNGEPPSSSEIIAEAKPSTMLVVVSSGRDRVGTGSGWVLDAEEGLIVTNAHVVDGGDRFQVGGSDDPNLRAATVVSVAPCDDLAVLRVRRTAGLRTLPLGSQSEVAQGDRVFAMGYPLNASTEDELQVTEGTVSVVESSLDAPAQSDPDFAVYPNTLQLDAAINGGNSGGPSINEAGELVGVNTVSGGGENQGFAIGVDRVTELMPQLRAGESLGWGGFGFVTASPEQAEKIGAAGLFVKSVVPQTGAAENDIFVGDYILEVNGTQVQTRQDYCNAVETAGQGEPILIEGIGSDGKPFAQRVPFE